MTDTPYDDGSAALLAEADRLEAEHREALAGVTANPDDPSAKRRWTAAQEALRAARKAWRDIGEGVAFTDPTHPGARPGIKVTNHTGDTP